MNEVLRRRAELYGPRRSLGREQAKSLQMEDHVKQNVLKGAGIDQYNSEDTFTTVSSDSFRARSGGKQESASNSSAQNATHLEFGSDKPSHLSVVQADYGPKPVTKNKQHIPPDIYLANIPDMAPRYQDNRSMGNSLYNADFDGEKSYELWSSRMSKDGRKVGRRQKTTLFQKSTHFELGSEPPSLRSETGTSFSGGRNEGHCIVGADRSQSNVFKAGDVVANYSDEIDRLTSVQMLDYGSPSTLEKDDAALIGGRYQTSTHFYFGDNREPTESIYKQDYQNEEVKKSTKSLPAPAPPSSKVMHEFPVVGTGATTSRNDFVKHDIVQREKQRLSSLQTNKERHSKLAVELKTGNQDKIATVMSSSYTAPSGNARPSTPIDPIPKNFHHLESNRALLNPPSWGSNVSEAAQHFTEQLSGPQECASRRVTAEGERTARISDSKHTHFVLGFDNPVDTSEKMFQYGAKVPVNPNLPAAGKPNLPTKGYSLIEHSVESHTDLSASTEGLQSVLQQRNYLKNRNPRDPSNVNLRKAFLEYDKDLSGSISKDEVKTVCKSVGIAVEEEELDSIIASCDTNGSGQIDYHNFALCLSRTQPPGVMDTAATTTTRTDYQHPQSHRVSEMQKRLMTNNNSDQNTVQKTHFFHLDTRDNYLLSTTRKDFNKPEEQ